MTKTRGASNIFCSSAIVFTVVRSKIIVYVIYVQYMCNLIGMFMCNYNAETCHIFFSSHSEDTVTQQIYRHYCTYPTNFFKICPVASKVDELFIKEPGELEVQRGVVRHLAGQHDALTDSHIHMSCWTGDQSLLCEQAATYHQWLSSVPDWPDCLLQVLFRHFSRLTYFHSKFPEYGRIITKTRHA